MYLDINEYLDVNINKYNVNRIIVVFMGFFCWNLTGAHFVFQPIICSFKTYVYLSNYDAEKTLGYKVHFIDLHFFLKKKTKKSQLKNKQTNLKN